jgi:hypothetical protein
LSEEVARWIHAHQIKQLRKGSSRVAPPRRVQREPKAPTNQRTVRAMFTPHASERRFTFAAYAKNHEIVRLPQHAAKPAVTRGTDVFGLGAIATENSEKPQQMVRNVEPVEDVFGLGNLKGA